MNDDITQKDDPITAATPGAKQGKPGSALEVLLAFFKLGVTCFGGPIAHIGYFREEFVVRRRWLDEQTYADLVGLCASQTRSRLRRRSPPWCSKKNEERFRTPEILRQHGIYRAMNVILQGDGKPFGVLEVDSRSEDEFVEHDLAFLQGAANILGMAIERERHERRLNVALQRDQFLLKEMNHRVKNSLAIVSSMLHLQARDVGNAELTGHLQEASQRVAAIARAHEQLYQGSDIEKLDIGRYIEAICKDLDASVAHCDIHIDVEEGIEVATDRAISSALIVNELITNAVKYAYHGEAGGIWISIARAGNDAFAISVRDEGVGLPPDFDPREAKGLGMRIVNSFAQQLNAKITVRARDPGTEFVLSIPLRV